jgi:predicted DNA-binding transcriptional regulator AlpA
MTETATAPGGKFLTTEEVCDRLGVKRTKLWTLRKEPGFPQPGRIGHRTLRWRADEIDAYFEASRIPAVTP